MNDYNPKEVSERIKRRAKEQGVVLKNMLEECGSSVNGLAQGSAKKGIGSFTIARIADYLECSVDYLLGRTENPNIMSEVYVNGNNHGIQTIKGNVNIGTMSQSKETNDITQEFMEVFEKLTLADKADAIKFVLDKMKK